MRQPGWPARAESRSVNRYGYADEDKRIMAVARLISDRVEGTAVPQAGLLDE